MMERIRAILMKFGFLTDTFPKTHELSRHAAIVPLVSSVFFISFDIMRTLKNDNSILWWSMHACLFLVFYFFLQPWVRFFSQPLIGEPSYSNFNKWYVCWLLVATVYHLPSSQSMGAYVRMNLSLFLTTFASSILFLFFFHFIFNEIRYFISLEARKWPDIWTILQVCAAVSIACCVSFSHCRERPLDQTNFIWYSIWNKNEKTTWLAAYLYMQELKDQVCYSLFFPVGSAIYPYYPLSYIWDKNSERHVSFKSGSSGLHGGSSDETFPKYSIWLTFIGIYIVNYIAERSPGSDEKYKKKKKQTEPDFLDMVPWYSGTSADLYRTVFDLLVSATVFLGRFDMRIFQAAMNQVQRLPINKKKVEDKAQQGDFLYDDFTEKKELWFDFMADTGDGGNSTYSVARLLAQPEIHVKKEEEQLILPRGDLLLIGGDIAYPNPSEFTYKNRLFRPFHYALQPSQCYKQDQIALNKPKVPDRLFELKQEKRRNKKKHKKQPKSYDGPRCFIIPGNHDWFDGLNTFIRNICHKIWLGGWFMPQKKSYFALQLPKGWWIFGLDLALHGDIDVYQFEFFSKLASKTVGMKDSVIIMTHQPDWLLDWYEDKDSSSRNNVSDLICNSLKERCKLRIAGDIHHYMHHSIVKSEGPNSSQRERKDVPVYAQHLLVNGCGGAFMHPTHVFRNFSQSHGVNYECEAAYPDFEQSSKLAFRNILNFRKENWQFDFIGGIIYFVLVFSMFPQCGLDHIFQADSISGLWRSFFGTVWNVFMYMLQSSYVSLGGAMLLVSVAIPFVPSKVSWKTRAIIGILHVSAHVAVALILMLVLELGVEMFVRQKLLATSGYHSLYQWYQSVESRHFPDPTGIRGRIEQWTFGLYPACMKYLMSAFDVPELMAVTRSSICKNGMENLSRGGSIIYYASVFLYFWVLSTPAVSVVFGSYLYICVNWFGLHYDEAFSSLRIADYKAFTRFHIKRNGDLEVFTLAVDKVPQEWKLDPDWEEEGQQDPEELSQHRKFPSQWRAAAADQDPVKTVRIIEHFVIQQKDKPVGSNNTDEQT